MATIQKRNYTVELFRFVFCLLIINYHFFSQCLVYSSAPKFFMKSHIGDEFFFILSGFFLAEAAMKTDKKPCEFAAEQVVKRVRKIAIPYYIVWFLCFVGRHITAFIRDGVVGSWGTDLINSLYELTFTRMIGFKKTYYSNSVAWFFSALLIVTALIGPLLVKYKKSFTQYIAPIITLVAYAWISTKFDYLQNPYYIMKGFLMLGLVRATAAMCGGIFLHGIIESQYFQSFKASCDNAKLSWIRLFDLLLWGVVIIYMVFPFETMIISPTTQYDYIICFILLIAIFPIIGTLGFSSKPEKGMIAERLGKYSYYAFFGQAVFYSVDPLVYDLQVPFGVLFLIMNASIAIITLLLWKIDQSIINYRRRVKEESIPA